MITAIVESWEENPFTEELKYLAGKLQMIGAVEFMVKTPAGIIEYADLTDKQKEIVDASNWTDGGKCCQGNGSAGTDGEVNHHLDTEQGCFHEYLHRGLHLLGYSSGTEHCPVHTDIHLAGPIGTDIV